MATPFETPVTTPNWFTVAHELSDDQPSALSVAFFGEILAMSLMDFPAHTLAASGSVTAVTGK